MPRTATRSPARAPRVAQRVERRDARAHERRGLDRRETVRDPRERHGGSDDVVRITAVVRDAR